VGPSQPIIFNNIISNADNQYDATTGIFTASRTGYYLIQFQLISNTFTGVVTNADVRQTIAYMNVPVAPGFFFVSTWQTRIPNSDERTNVTGLSSQILFLNANQQMQVIVISAYFNPFMVRSTVIDKGSRWTLHFLGEEQP
jgi:hypothetical protein